ncbi:transcriptional regulator [Saccharospirillum sp. MSK14-1]|uniref:helix-turn-helix transcriptional regulator n=1 Tax=Saccharospirillum sp. MSK14-1 TaxID=1897632 RepID=UPI000D34716D|nr:YafY family protein [Saccharospirillum sp. MSK14-1]PTY37934.1 transcriptional regulator [Saccharospirillum sp. MSK14-1]
MTRPTTRVLTLLELLQTHRRLSGSELARRLEVDGRTVRRYIQALEEMGVPVVAERGRDGGYSLVAGFKLPPMMFTDEETLAVALGLVAASGLGLAENDVAVASVRAKLERVMPDGLKRRVRAIGETTQMARTPARTEIDEGVFITLTETSLAQQRVRLTYCSVDGEVSERELDPYGLVFRAGYWYVSGYCHLRQDLRSFRLDRVTRIAALPHSFLRPADFDAARYLSDSLTGLFAGHENLWDVEIELHTQSHNVSRQLGWFGGVYIPIQNGLLLRTRTPNLDWLAVTLCGLSVDFTILQPLELRTAITQHAEHLLRLVNPAE